MTVAPTNIPTQAQFRTNIHTSSAEVNADIARASIALLAVFQRAIISRTQPTIEEAREGLRIASLDHASVLATVVCLLASNVSKRDTASMSGVPHQAIKSWLNIPAFRQAVSSAFEANANAMTNHALFNKQRRMTRLANRADAIDEAIEARAARFQDDHDAPEEAHTGLFVRELVFNSRTGAEHSVYKFDTSLAKELREIEKQAGIEAGQWQSDEGLQRNQKLYAEIDVNLVLGLKPNNTQIQITGESNANSEAETSLNSNKRTVIDVEHTK